VKALASFVAFSPGRAAAGVSAAFAIMFATATPAQVPPDAGTSLRMLEPPTLTLPRKPPPGADIEPPARPALQPGPVIRFKLKAFRITGATVFPESELQQHLQEQVGRYVDSEVGITELREAAALITRFYALRGFPLATAYLPAQEIKDGVVEIAILEGRYGKVQLLNRSRASDATVSAYLDGLPGLVVQESRLERQLLLVYDLPGVKPGSAVLSPGEVVGETDLHLELNAGRAYSGTAELDNYGSQFSGANRLSAQLDLFSPTSLGDWLSLRATKGDPGLEYAHVDYQVPVGGQGVRLGTAYSHLRYALGESFASLGANGDADMASVSAAYPIERSRQRSLYARLGYELKWLEDRITSTATVTDKRSRLLTLALSGDYFDDLGGSAANAFSIGYGQGNLQIETPEAKAIDDASARTDGGFYKWTWNYTRLQKLTDPLSLFVTFYGQKAGKNLDSSEKMILGGPYGVRAYPQGEAPSDSGYVLTGELRYAFNVPALPGSWYVSAFVDTGQAKLNEVPFSAVPNNRRLSGGGLGANWAKADDFALKLAIAHRIGNAAATAGDDDHTRGWLQAIKYF
jgi:hemolysin activation/secretion protein